jgi:hypothetical protein
LEFPSGKSAFPPGGINLDGLAKAQYRHNILN